MIKINSYHNLEQVLDYVGKMNNDIQAIIASAIAEAKEEVYQELISTYQIGDDDLEIDIQYDTSSYRIIVNGINQYQLNSNLAIDMDYILDVIESKVLEVIQRKLINTGYSSGNKRI